MKKTIDWLNNAIKGNRYIIVILVIIQSLISFINIENTVFIKRIIDSVVEGDKKLFVHYGTIMVILALIWLLCGAINRYLIEYGKASIENRLKEKLIYEILNRNYAQVTNYHSQEWMNKLTSDCVIVADGCISILPNMFAMLVQLLYALIVMFKIIPQFSIVLVPVGIILVVITYFFRKKLKLLHKNIQEADGDFRVFVSEHIENLMVVKAFNKEEATLTKANEKMENHKNQRMKRALFSDFSNVGFSTLMRGSYVLCIILGAYEILIGKLSYGSFMAMIQLIGQIQSPFANVSSFIPRLFTLSSSAERLMLVESFGIDHYSLDNTNKDFEEFGLHDVTFTYQSSDNGKQEAVLENLDIEIKKNQFIGFAGPSGSGKSTVLKILMCLYPIDKGERYIIRNGSKEELTSLDRNLFAYVPQGNQLMSGSIKDVVTFNNAKDIDIDKLHEALRIACADGFVNDLEEKTDYILGEKGKGLSEGQIQRLAIARAIYSNKPVLLLDEVTSSLDAKTEIKLLNNLRELKDKTVIIITHRNSALEYCDKIVYFD